MRTEIRGGRVLDGTGAAPLADGSVIVEDGRIAAAGKAASERAEADGSRVVDARGGTILPGFFDLHVHLCHTLADSDIWGWPMGHWLDDREQTLNGVLQGQRAVDAGLTTVRDTGEASPGVFSLRALWSKNILRGPRALACGRAVCETGGHGYRTGREADGVDEVRKATREQIKVGADWIKVAATGGARGPVEKITSTQLDEDEMRMVVHEAAKVGMKVCAHAHAADGIKNALRAGIKTIEHGVLLDDEAVALMVENDAYLVATLSVYRALSERGAAKGAEDYAQEKAREVMVHHSTSLRRALDGGVKIAFGTDAGGPYHPIGKTSVVEELEMMREAGMSPMQTIESLTRVSAEALGLDDRLGTLQAGKLADVVIVDGDPLKDVSAIGRVKFVMKEGVVLKDELTAA